MSSFLLPPILILFFLLLAHPTLSQRCQTERSKIIESLFLTNKEFEPFDKLAPDVLLRNSPVIHPHRKYKKFGNEVFEGKDDVNDFWNTFKHHVTITSARRITSFIQTQGDLKGGYERFELFRLGMSLNENHWIQDFMCHIIFNDDCEVREWILTYDPSFLLISMKNNDDVAMPQSASVEPSVVKPDGAPTEDQSKELAKKVIKMLQKGSINDEELVELFGDDNEALVTFPGDERILRRVTGAFLGNNHVKEFFDTYFSRFNADNDWQLVETRADSALLYASQSGKYKSRKIKYLKHYILIQTGETQVDGENRVRIKALNHVVNPVALSGDVLFQSPGKGVSLIIQIILVVIVIILSGIIALLLLCNGLKNAERRLLHKHQKESNSSDWTSELQPLRTLNDDEEYQNADDQMTPATNNWTEDRDHNNDNNDNNDNQV